MRKWQEVRNAMLHVGPSYNLEPLPQRGDSFEQWLKRQRDEAIDYPEVWDMMDGLLDLYRLHADTRTPLTESPQGPYERDCD